MKYTDKLRGKEKLKLYISRFAYGDYSLEELKNEFYNIIKDNSNPMYYEDIIRLVNTTYMNLTIGKLGTTLDTMKETKSKIIEFIINDKEAIDNAIGKVLSC
jgi:hypothetical protein